MEARLPHKQEVKGSSPFSAPNGGYSVCEGIAGISDRQGQGYAYSFSCEGERENIRERGGVYEYQR